MVPRVGRQGRSFKGTAAYYLHDKDASTSERVAWTHTENLPTDDPDRAFDWMAYTAMDAENIKRESGVKRTGGPAEKPVFTLSLSWHPEQEPTQEHMIDAANSALAVLGLQNRQTVMVAHNDEAHPHIHAIVNLIDPESGRSASLPFAKERLSKWAEAYEREHGKIYCEQRVENNAKREKAKEQDNEAFPRYKDPEVDHKALVADLYRAADSGKAFQAALSQHGYTLAQGKRIVIIDAAGKSHSIARWIDGAKEKDVRAKLADITLPNVNEAQGKQQGGRTENEEQDTAKDQEKRRKAPLEDPSQQPTPPDQVQGVLYFDRDEQDRQWQESIIDAGIHADQEKRPRPRSTQAKVEKPDANRLNQIQDRQLAELGRFYSEITDARLKLNAEIETTYGADERRLRQEISDRESSLKNAGRLRRALMHLTGRYARTQREITERNQSLQNIEWRKQERTSALEKQIGESRQLIGARGHQQERQPGRAHNEYERRQPGRVPAPAKDFQSAHDRAPDSGYEARRAAFMGEVPAQREQETEEIEVSQAATPPPPDTATTLAQEFEEAAAYEARRAAFMESYGNHSHAQGLSEGGGASHSPSPSDQQGL